MLDTEHMPNPRSSEAGRRNREAIRQRYDGGMQPRAIARALDLGESYVYRVIRQYLAEREAQSA